MSDGERAGEEQQGGTGSGGEQEHGTGRECFLASGASRADETVTVLSDGLWRDANVSDACEGGAKEGWKGEGK